MFIGFSVVGAFLKDFHWEKLSPFDKACGGWPFLLNNLDIEESKVGIAISINWQALISGVGTSEGGNEHPVGADDDSNTDSWVVVKLQKSEALAVLTEKGLSLETLLMQANTVREIELMQGEDVGVVDLWDIRLLLGISL